MKHIQFGNGERSFFFYINKNITTEIGSHQTLIEDT